MQIVITCLILSKKKYRILFKKNIELNNNHKVINAIILIVILVLKIWWMLCLILYE